MTTKKNSIKSVNNSTNVISVSDIEKMLGIENQNKGKFNSVLGSNKESIFRKETLNYFIDKGKKSSNLRTKARNKVQSYAKSIINLTDKKEIKDMFDAFNNFYKLWYKTNDYSLSSLCSDNMDKDKKDNIIKMLAIFKDNNLIK